MKRLTTLLLAASCAAFASAHGPSQGRKIIFPDVAGYLTLKCDLHTHSVFSDGSVWPDVRVQEAVRDGLDALAMTEHLEYQPHSDDIPHPDRNRAYQLAVEIAQGSNLLILPGSEITRDLPPGHSNAVFIQDANWLLIEDPIEVFREAKRQGAFVFWNHPNWTGQQSNGVATLTDMHRRLIEEGLVQGIEVINDVTFSDEALEIALDHDLTILGTSDVHGLVDWRYQIAEGGHRPITLVFAAERSAESIQEGLVAGRTVAWLGDLLVGKEPLLSQLLTQSLVVTEAVYRGDTSVLDVTIENRSSASLTVRNLSRWNLHQHGDVLTLPGQSTSVLAIKTLTRLGTTSLELEVLSALTAPRRHPRISLSIDTR